MATVKDVCYALRHGLTPKTVIAALECAGGYRALEASLIAEHSPRTATERELMLRLAAVLWRLRRAAHVETGLFASEAELMQEAEPAALRERTTRPSPQWLDESEIASTSVPTIPLVRRELEPSDADPTFQLDNESAKELAACFLRVNRLGYGTFDLLQRYETALWRQAAQILVLLRTADTPSKG